MVSDGTFKLKVVNTHKWQHEKTIPVFKKRQVKSKNPMKKDQLDSVKDHVPYLNELEIIQSHPDFVFANVISKPSILLIDLRSGEVVKDFDFLEFKEKIVAYVK